MVYLIWLGSSSKDLPSYFLKTEPDRWLNIVHFSNSHCILHLLEDMAASNAGYAQFISEAKIFILGFMIIGT